MQAKHAVVALAVFGMTGFSAASDGDALFKARLSGDHEDPPVQTDTSGRFEVLLAKDGASAEYTLRVDGGVRLTQAHFHCGPAGVNGPVIVFLAGFHPSGWDVDGKWVSNATITNANIVNTACGTTLEAIFDAARAGNVYVNAHSVAVPSGVVRGQLEPTSN